MDPKGKTALVTGGAVRVGQAISLGLARAGANIVINYNASAQAAEETAAAVEALGVGALAVRADISDAVQVASMVEAARQRFGTVDVLINSASLFLDTPFPTTDLEGWQRVTGIGIDGPYYCANAVAPLMLARGAGVIINIADLSGLEPWPGFIAHSVSKAAILALTRQFALELGPAVRVNAVAPGPVLPPPDYTPEQIARVAELTLLDRWGSPEDVVEAILFLIRAEYINADVIFVDGGERFGHRKREIG